jgi:hypothetical protein
MRFGLHPVYLLVLIALPVILLGGAFALGWGFRKGWESAGRDQSGTGDRPPQP